MDPLGLDTLSVNSYYIGNYKAGTDVVAIDEVVVTCTSPPEVRNYGGDGNFT